MKRALGIDLGEARVGVAISDSLGLMAHPRETIRVDKNRPQTTVARVVEVAMREDVSVVVLGLPRNMDGTDGPAAQKAREFADALRAKLPAGCSVRLLDERMTTVAAQKALHAGGKNVKNSRAIIDQVAAQLILQTHLDSESLRAELTAETPSPQEET